MYFEMCTSSEEWTCSWVPQGLVAHWNRTVCNTLRHHLLRSMKLVQPAQIWLTNTGSCLFLWNSYTSSLVHVWGGRGEVPLSWHKLKWWLANQLQVQYSQLALQNFLSHQMCSCWGWLEPADPGPILACRWGHVMKFHVSIRDAKGIVCIHT